MNEYTRREEARWTFIASLVLVVAIAAGALLVFTAKGPLVPDPAAKAAAREAEARSAQVHQCVAWAKALATELPIFRTSAKAVLEPEPPDPKRPARPPKKPKEPDADLAWQAALPVAKLVAQLATCRAPVEAAIGTRADATPAWNAIAAAAAVPTPAAGDRAVQLTSAKKLFETFATTNVDGVLSAAQAADAALKTLAETEAKRAQTALVRADLPPGILSRDLAIAIGVGLSIAALLLSFLSVRAASLRRAATLVPLRDVARTPQRGLQAAAILKLAAQPNGGEPGLVIGAGIGGLVAALAFRTDSDIFVAGVMAGLVIGLSVQWIARTLMGMSRWRARAVELGEVEKPAIPIVLVLSGVNVGLEDQFVSFFEKLHPGDAAATVDKLAAQAEERILAAADAGAIAAQQAPQQPIPPYGPGG